MVEDVRRLLLLSGHAFTSTTMVEDVRRLLLLSGHAFTSTTMVEDVRRLLLLSGHAFTSTTMVEDVARLSLRRGEHKSTRQTLATWKCNATERRMQSWHRICREGITCVVLYCVR
jgi:hypothetical protein